MSHRSIVSWNAMINGYYRSNMISEALDLISCMHFSDIKFNETTFATTLGVCGRAVSLTPGKQIHELVLKSGYLRFKLVGSSLLYVYANCCKIGDGRMLFDELHHENNLLWSLMLMGYVECGLMHEARCIFQTMPKRSVVDWTTLISGYSKSENCCKEALEMFKVMRLNGEAIPNEFTLDCVLRACSELGDASSGRMVHTFIVKCGYEHECSIGGALLSLYCRCGSMDEAEKIYCEFGHWAESIEASHHLMIHGYAMCGRLADAERLFMEMSIKTLTSLNTMILAYARNGEIDKAVKIFESAKGEGSSITWNSMISAYIQNHQLEDALLVYLAMHRLQICKTRSTFSALFRACACLGSLQQGQLLHSHVEKSPYSINVYVGTALTDMYSKCGSLADAREAFRSVSSPNVATWTAMINGFAHHGHGSDAITSFNLMLQRGITPNEASFVAVLSACSHAGFLEMGMKLFHTMIYHYGISPTVEHFTCLVELLGKQELANEAKILIQTMGIEADKALLISLLNANWSCMDIKSSKQAAEKVVSLDPRSSSSAYVIMSNMYSRTGKWRERMKVREILRETGVKKDPGCSWISINNTTYVFSVNYRNHPKSDLMFAALESLKANAYSYAQVYPSFFFREQGLSFLSLRL